MAVLAAACMVVLAEQATVFGVALLWFLLQRVPERRVRHPERGHPGPRAGAAARHGVRLGGHADRARPGARHRPGRGRPRPAPGGRVRHARGADGAAGAAVRAVHPRLSARAARPGAVLLAPAGLVLLAQPAGVPRFRLGLADPLPDQPGHRHGHAVPALLPARRGALRAAVPRPDRGGRPAHPDPDLHRLRGARLDRRRGDLRPPRPPQDAGHRVRPADGRGRAAADVRRDVGRGAPARRCCSAWATAPTSRSTRR